MPDVTTYPPGFSVPYVPLAQTELVVVLLKLRYASSMSNIDAVNIEDKQWIPLDDGADSAVRVWKNGADKIFLRYFPIPPDIPAPLSRPDLIWKISRLQSLWNQAAPVDLYTSSIGNAACLAQIVKFSLNGKIQYQGALIIPRSSFSHTFIVPAESVAADAERDQYVERTILIGITDLDERARQWFRDPYAFNLVTPIGRCRSDDEEWDVIFPGHPLSRIRSILRALPQMCKIDPDVFGAAPFIGPSVGPSVEREVEQIAEFFSVRPEEQRDLDELSNNLARIIEEVVAKSRLNSSTEPLSVEDPIFAKSDLREFADQFKERKPSASQTFANAIAELVSAEKDRNLCLIMYSSRRDPTFYQSLSMVSRFYGERDNNPESLKDADTMAGKEALHWEFLISRLLRGVNMRLLSLGTSLTFGGYPQAGRFLSCHMSTT